MLYWPELIALILASLILGRLKSTPLRTHDWLLLGLGFSTSFWLAFAVVAVWLIVHGTRRSWGTNITEPVYRVTQIGFGALTLAAFAAIVAGIGAGLLGNPDMSVTGLRVGGQRTALVCGPDQQRDPGSRGVLRAPVGVQGADSDLGAVALLCAHPLAALGLAPLLGRTDCGIAAAGGKLERVAPFAGAGRDKPIPYGALNLPTRSIRLWRLRSRGPWCCSRG